MSYLDLQGLNTLWTKIKNRLTQNVGLYGGVIARNYSYSSPLITLSDAAWHPLNLMAINHTETLGTGFFNVLFRRDALIKDGEQYTSFYCLTPGLYSVEGTVLASGESTGCIIWAHLAFSSESGTHDYSEYRTASQYWYPPASGSHVTITVPVSAIKYFNVGDTVVLEAARSSSGSNVRVQAASLTITCISDVS